MRNLVDQIAARIEEYSMYVGKNEQIQIELDTRCSKDPTSCFFTTIVGPLRKLKQPVGIRFIVIDALDECFEGDMKTSEIIEILQSKLLHFPKWLKVILTSRNVTSVTSRFPQVQISRMPLFATDERNVDDIRFYVSRFISQNTDFSHRVMTAVNIGTKRGNVKTFLNRVITQTEGNFLFVKMTLQYMNDTGKTVDFHSLPTTLFGFYDSFFKRQFGEDRFAPFRSIFEVLLALYSPLSSQDVQEIVESQYEAEDISKIIERMSCFLRFGRDGTIRIYHQSFADWLKNQTTVLALNQTRGHQNIAKFLLHRVREKNVDVTFKELTELFMHILSGWSGRSYERHETAMKYFNIIEMRESQTNQSILHYLVTQPTTYLPVLDFFLPKFQTVDVVDSNKKTPAFYAASEGFVSSLQSCINNGADISSFMKGYTEIDPVSIVVRNAGIEEFSLIHAAAAKGRTDVVELLIQSNVSIPNTTSYPTPLHLAAGNGQLEVVKLFYEHNVTFDLITLHHAAARNHLSVVTFLLHTVGLRDTCLPCQSSKKDTVQETHTYFCETALHAAVSRGLDDIVKVLLSYGRESLECKHHSGKTVLIDAVERNDTEMVDLLLRHGADVTTVCGLKTWRNSDICSLYSMFKQDFLYTVYCREDNCPSGYSAIHISAKYGLWKVAERLASGRIEEILLSANTDGRTPVRIAIAYDQKDFLQNVNISLRNVGRYLVGSIMVQFAAAYCSPNVAKLFLNEPFDDKDKKLWDLLLYTVRWSPCNDFKSNKYSESNCLKAFEETNLSEEEKTKMESDRRLNIIKTLIETHQKYELLRKIQDGMTLLHHAAFFGFEDAVKYLVERGVDIFLRDSTGDTPLMVALKTAPVNDLHPSASYRCYTTNDGQFRSCKTTCHDEIVRYLIQSQRSRFSKCDTEEKYVLEQVIRKRMPLSLYALLKIGAHSKCVFSDSGSVMLLHLRTGGREISEVLNMFEVGISLKCDVPFRESELHQMSFLIQPSSNEKLIPLQRLIDRHPKGVRILDECYDAEGYLPIHRAAQGGNLAAIKWFKGVGLNTQLKTQSGLTALEICLLLLPSAVETNLKYRHGCLEELLKSYFDISYKNYSSDFRSVFEVLLAVNSSLLSNDFKGILESQYEAEDVSKIIEQTSYFLQFGRDGTVRIYHQSFANWLKNQTTVLALNKTRGHQNIAKFLLHRSRERNVDVTFKELTELFMHILSGWSGRAYEMQETAMNHFNILEMRDSQTNQTILHYLVTQPTTFLPVLDFFLSKFQTVDVLDSNDKTPAFYAASEGFVSSLQRCINNGGDISSFMKGYTEIDVVSNLVRNVGIEEFSFIHAAAAKGHADVVELLIKSNISIPNNTSYPTPLHLAAGNGHLEVVKLFYEHNVTFDLITLHHAAARNHLSVVTFLLHTAGLRDTCLPCQSSKQTTIQETHTYFCETALHAAVSRGLHDIVKVLLSYGKKSLECKHHSGKTVLIDAVERNDTEMVDLLFRHGADVTTQCADIVWMDSDMCFMCKPDFLYTIYCENDSCPSGYKAIDISAKYGLWKVARILLSGVVDGEIVNSAIEIGIAYDQKDFLQNFKNSLQSVGQNLDGLRAVQLAVAYCSANVAKLFLNEPFEDKDKNLWNLLLQTIRWSPCGHSKINEYPESQCLKALEESNLSEAEKTKKESERRLNIIKALIETNQKYELLSKKEDETTLLHYAVLFGFEDAVKYLVERGVDTFLKYPSGDTPLMFALKSAPVTDLHPSTSYRCYTTNDGEFRSCKTTCYDEIVRCLIQSQRSSFSKCDGKRKYILAQALVKRMPLSLYALLKIRDDSTCLLSESVSVMLVHLRTGGREISEVLNMFHVDISLKCDVTFYESELHQMSFLFQPPLHKELIPLHRLIDRHPKGVRILDECYDAEGYLPIHRAAQGGNLAAIKWFKGVGVNTQLKTRSGLTALEICLLLLQSSEETNWKYRHGCFEELLQSYFDTSYKKYSSDFSSLSFSKYCILHSASRIGLDASKNLWNIAFKIIPGLEENKFLLLNEQDKNGNTPLHIAADEGLEDVVKYLVRLGADTNVKNKEGNTPLMTALHVSSDDLTILNHDRNEKCFTTNDDLFRFCGMTSHDEIVKYLLWLQKSSISKCDKQSAYLLNQVISKRLPLSLYALLKIGVEMNCQTTESLSPLLQHIKVGSPEVSEVLKTFEVGVTARCLVPFSVSELHLISYVSTSEDFGNFFQPSSNNKRFPLQRLIDRHPKGVRIFDECYDAEGYLPIHRAAQGGNLAAIKWFKSVGVNTQLKTRSGFTALKISLRSLKFSAETNWKYRHGCLEELLQSYFDTSYKKYSSDFSSLSFSKYCILHSACRIGLDAFKNLWNIAFKIIPGLEENKFLLLNEQDKNGNTPLHIAADEGLEDLVKYLVRLGADTNVKNKEGNTPLMTALHVSSDDLTILNHDRKIRNEKCFTTNDGLFGFCEMTSHDEIVNYLLRLQKSSISKCDGQSAFLLNQVISKRLALSLYALLKIGVELNCQENESLSPFLHHMRVGGPKVSEVLKIFEVEISAKCLVPFSSSELHLVSYVSTAGLGNFFQPSINNKRIPLQRLIDRHPKGVRILDECYDAEGYLPIHRAAQGGNLAAIKWFKGVGVNTQLKTRSGLTALDISILYLGNISYAELTAPSSYRFWHKSYMEIPVRTSTYPRQVFEELLQTFFRTTPEYRTGFLCGPTLEGLSPLHIAAVKGMAVLRYVHKKASEIFPSLPINCLNKHRLDPVYLANVYDYIRNEGLKNKFSGNNFLLKLEDQLRNMQEMAEINIDIESGDENVPAAQYPDREVDYILIHDFLYRPPFETTEEELLLGNTEVRIQDCPGYYDKFPKSVVEEAVLERRNSDFPISECDKVRVRHDYYWSLCMREHKKNNFRAHNCPHILSELRWRYAGRLRWNRQLSRFILKRLGWKDASQIKSSDTRWPIFFLHKMVLKKYQAYEYLKVLNKALEMTDIHFYDTAEYFFDSQVDP